MQSAELTILDLFGLYQELKARKGVPKCEMRLLRGALVIKLFDQDDLPLANIAEIVDRSQETVRKILKDREAYHTDGSLAQQCIEKSGKRQGIVQAVKISFERNPNLVFSAK